MTYHLMEKSSSIKIILVGCGKVLSVDIEHLANHLCLDCSTRQVKSMLCRYQINLKTIMVNMIKPDSVVYMDSYLSYNVLDISEEPPN